MVEQSSMATRSVRVRAIAGSPPNFDCHLVTPSLSIHFDSSAPLVITLRIAAFTLKNQWFCFADEEMTFKQVMRRAYEAREFGHDFLENRHLRKPGFNPIPTSEEPEIISIDTKNTCILREKLFLDTNGKWQTEQDEFNFANLYFCLTSFDFEEEHELGVLRRVNILAKTEITGRFAGYFHPTRRAGFCRQPDGVRVLRTLEVWKKLTLQQLTRGTGLSRPVLAGLLGHLASKNCIKKQSDHWIFLSVEPMGLEPLIHVQAIKERARDFNRQVFSPPVPTDSHISYA
jgi:hypothetical protein